VRYGTCMLLGLAMASVATAAANEVRVAFLDAGRPYVAHVYEDARPRDNVRTRTQVRIRRYRVDRATVLKADLLPSGGQAVRLVPAEK